MRIFAKLFLIVSISVPAAALVNRAGVGAQQPTEQGTEVLTRGPVHEAFAEPMTGQPQPGPIVPQQPPDLIDEMPPDQKPEGNTVQWIPGYWHWDDDSANYLWVSGFWRDVPPDRQWVPGTWNQVQGGWQWAPGYWADAQQQDVTYLPPPPPSIDNGPSTPAPNPDSVYVPGIWVYRDSRYLWRPGFFIAYNPDWVYTPACYQWTPAGYVFVDGYWDYPLTRRGLLFAPVLFDRALRTRPGWSYTPEYVISPTDLLTALFVRPAYEHYYFGDYFEPEYERHGFVPWIDYRINRRVADPLFVHLRGRHHGDERWEHDLRTVYAERRAGQAPRPPRTLAQLQQDMGNLPREGKTTVQAHQVQMVAPLRVLRNTVKLQTVPRVQLAEEHKAAQQIIVARQLRQRTEASVLSKGGPPTKLSDQPRTAKLEYPRTLRSPASAPVKVQRPPTPSVPNHVERSIPQHQPLNPVRAPSTPLKVGSQRLPGTAQPPAQNPRPPAPPQQQEVRPPVQKPKPPAPPQQQEVRPPVQKPRPPAAPPQQQEARPPAPPQQQAVRPPVQNKKPPAPPQQHAVRPPVQNLKPPAPPQQHEARPPVQNPRPAAPPQQHEVRPAGQAPHPAPPVPHEVRPSSAQPARPAAPAGSHPATGHKDGDGRPPG
jgi:hypothetical protein